MVVVVVAVVVVVRELFQVAQFHVRVHDPRVRAELPFLDETKSLRAWEICGLWWLAANLVESSRVSLFQLGSTRTFGSSLPLRRHLDDPRFHQNAPQPSLKPHHLGF